MKNCSPAKEWDTEWQGPQMIVEVSEAATTVAGINGTNTEGMWYYLLHIKQNS